MGEVNCTTQLRPLIGRQVRHADSFCSCFSTDERLALRVPGLDSGVQACRSTAHCVGTMWNT